VQAEQVREARRAYSQICPRVIATPILVKGSTGNPKYLHRSRERALGHAADVRDTAPRDLQQALYVEGCVEREGEILKGNGAPAPLTLRDVTNKIVHGTPDTVEVAAGIVRLHFKSNMEGDGWTSAWFSATQLLNALSKGLFKHHSEAAERREKNIRELLEVLGADRLGPMLPSQPDATVT
jgi:hypothetical protein